MSGLTLTTDYFVSFAYRGAEDAPACIFFADVHAFDGNGAPLLLAEERLAVCNGRDGAMMRIHHRPTENEQNVRDDFNTNLRNLMTSGAPDAAAS